MYTWSYFTYTLITPYIHLDHTLQYTWIISHLDHTSHTLDSTLHTLDHTSHTLGSHLTYTWITPYIQSDHTVHTLWSHPTYTKIIPYIHLDHTLHTLDCALHILGSYLTYNWITPHIHLTYNWIIPHIHLDRTSHSLKHILLIYHSRFSWTEPCYLKFIPQSRRKDQKQGTQAYSATVALHGSYLMYQKLIMKLGTYFS